MPFTGLGLGSENIRVTTTTKPNHFHIEKTRLTLENPCVKRVLYIWETWSDLYFLFYILIIHLINSSLTSDSPKSKDIRQGITA